MKFLTSVRYLFLKENTDYVSSLKGIGTYINATLLLHMGI